MVLWLSQGSIPQLLAETRVPGAVDLAVEEPGPPRCSTFAQTSRATNAVPSPPPMLEPFSGRVIALIALTMPLCHQWAMH